MFILKINIKIDKSVIINDYLVICTTCKSKLTFDWLPQTTPNPLSIIPLTYACGFAHLLCFKFCNEKLLILVS